MRNRRWEGSVKMGKYMKGVKVNEYFCLRLRSIGGFYESDYEPLVLLILTYSMEQSPS